MFAGLFTRTTALGKGLGLLANLIFHGGRLAKSRVPIATHGNALLAIETLRAVEQLEGRFALLAAVTRLATLRDRLKLPAQLADGHFARRLCLTRWLNLARRHPFELAVIGGQFFRSRAESEANQIVVRSDRLARIEHPILVRVPRHPDRERTLVDVLRHKLQLGVARRPLLAVFR